MIRNSAVARHLIETTKAEDAKFTSKWIDHYTARFIFSIAADDTYIIMDARTSEVLAIGAMDIDADYDCGEKCNMVKILKTGKIHFSDGLWESYKLAVA